MNKITVFTVFVLFALAAQVTALSYGAITIYKYNDSNGNGIIDKAEKGTTGSFTVLGPGVNKTLSINKNNCASVVVIIVPYGVTYTVTENVPAGYVSTTKNPQTALIKAVSKCNASVCGAVVLLKFGTVKRVATTTSTTTTTTTTTSTTTTTTTIPAEQQLTASNLLNCIKSRKGKLYTDTQVGGPACVTQKQVFYNETVAPVGPGNNAFDQLAVEGSSGIIPRWEYKSGGQDVPVNGCQTFGDLNRILSCGLIAIPGHNYQKC